MKETKVVKKSIAKNSYLKRKLFNIAYETQPDYIYSVFR